MNTKNNNNKPADYVNTDEESILKNENGKSRGLVTEIEEVDDKLIGDDFDLKEVQQNEKEQEAKLKNAESNY